MPPLIKYLLIQLLAINFFSQNRKQVLNFGSDASYRFSDDILVIFRLVPNDLNWFLDFNPVSWLSFFKFYSFSVSDDIFDYKLLSGICIYVQFFGQVIHNDIFYVVWSRSQHHLLADSSCMMCRRHDEQIIWLTLALFKARIICTRILSLCYPSSWLAVTLKRYKLKYEYAAVNLNSKFKMKSTILCNYHHHHNIHSNNSTQPQCQQLHKGVWYLKHQMQQI